MEKSLEKNCEWYTSMSTLLGKPKEFEVYLKKNFMLYFAVNFGRQI